jgi:hypothetical protein
LADKVALVFGRYIEGGEIVGWFSPSLADRWVV